MAQKIVSTQAELLSALSIMKSADTILLNDGHYGDLSIIQKKYGANVTIAALNEHGATFSGIDIRNSTNLSFLGIEVEGEFRTSVSTKNITLDGVKATTFYFRDTDGLSVDHSEASGGWYNLVMNGVKNFSVTNSHFHGATEDISRIVGNTHDGIIANNIFSETNSTGTLHPDLMQMFRFNGATPHDITISGNLFWDDPRTGSSYAQGIFLTDASSSGYRDILIEENLISVSSANSIYIDGGQENVVMQDNTLLADKGSTGATIRLAKKSGFDNSGVTVEGNVARSIIDETKKSDIGDNFVYARTDPDPKQNFQWENGKNWDDFLPVKGSVADFGSGYGAQERLAELVKSGSFWDSHYITPDFALPDHVFDPLYMREGNLNFTGALNRVMEIADTDNELALSEGTIAFTFKADMVSWRRTLVSKDAAETGNHFSVMIKDGGLDVKFGDDADEQTISIKGIAAKTNYDFVASFDEGGAKAWLDGKLIGSVDLHMDWSDNDEALLLGADNSVSTPGTISGMRYPYDGVIQNFLIDDQAMTPEQLQAELVTIGLA